MTELLQTQELMREMCPRIPNYSGKITLFENKVPIHTEKTEWSFYPDGERRDIPVYSIWNYEHHDEIASSIAQGKSAAIYMWGTFGAGMLLDSPQWQKSGEIESAKLRDKLKKNRPWSHQFAIFMHPDDEIDFWDIDRFHSTTGRFQYASDRWRLYQGGPVHIIAYTKPNNPHLDPSLYRDSDQTASYFYMPHPAMNRLISLLRKEVSHSIFGGGSLNPHGDSPPFSTEELHTMISFDNEWQKNIDLVIIDEIPEFFKIFRSQLQVRVPEKGSDGYWQKLRDGGVESERWAKQMGVQIKDAPEGVKKASSMTPYFVDMNKFIDAQVQLSMEAMMRLDIAIKSGII